MGITNKLYALETNDDLFNFPSRGSSKPTCLLDEYTDIKKKKKKTQSMICENKIK